jgi:hypothetical protein
MGIAILVGDSWQDRDALPLPLHQRKQPPKTHLFLKEKAFYTCRTKAGVCTAQNARYIFFDFMMAARAAARAQRRRCICGLIASDSPPPPSAHTFSFRVQVSSVRTKDNYPIRKQKRRETFRE